jgi:hypothetical protein
LYDFYDHEVPYEQVGLLGNIIEGVELASLTRPKQLLLLSAGLAVAERHGGPTV